MPDLMTILSCRAGNYEDYLGYFRTRNLSWLLQEAAQMDYMWPRTNYWLALVKAVTEKGGAPPQNRHFEYRERPLYERDSSS